MAHRNLWQVRYIEENVGALKVKLSKEDLGLIRDLITKSNATEGDRYPEFGMRLAYADTPELDKWKGEANTVCNNFSGSLDMLTMAGAEEARAILLI